MGVLAKRKKKRDGGEIPMASTSDVAFLLLIFFIVMPMKADEIGISLVLPGKAKDRTDTARVSQKNVATIRVLPSNMILFDEQPVRLGDLQRLIQDRIASNDKTVVILETHPDANYGMMVACLDEVKLSGARKFSLKTTKL